MLRDVPRTTEVTLIDTEPENGECYQGLQLGVSKASFEYNYLVPQAQSHARRILRKSIFFGASTIRSARLLDAPLKKMGGVQPGGRAPGT